MFCGATTPTMPPKRRDDADDAAEAARLQKDDGQTVATDGGA
jgi:hypothetical protein